MTLAPNVLSPIDLRGGAGSLFDGFSLMPLSLLWFPSLHEDVIRDEVPGIVNANEEQEQRRGAHEDQCRRGWEKAAQADTASIAYAVNGSKT